MENIKNMIYTIRGVKVMLDSDLAQLYDYTTKAFNQQVKNNIEKFDSDFRFQLTRDEYHEILRSKNLTLELENDFLRSIFLTSKDKRGGRQYLPFVFTEQGIYMLMTVLKGELATKQSKALIRTYDTPNENIFHCGASSKDAGNKITSITKINDKEIYHHIVDILLGNPILTL